MEAKVHYVLLVLQLVRGGQVHRDPPRVGIVGAGIGGASAAYFISQQLPGANITVFEKDKVGGRLATVVVDGREYETGGSIIHPANKYMVDFLPICGLKKKTGPPEFGGGSGFTLHGQEGEIVFQESTNSWLNKMRMIWRYGIWSLLKLEKFIENLLDNFIDIYPKLDSGAAYDTVEDVLMAMSPVSKKGEKSGEMLELTKASLWRQLTARVGLDPLLTEELVTVATRVNYGQFTDVVHAFVGGVGLAGIQDGLWAVEGGNYRVAECAVERAGARVVKGVVEEVEKGEQGGTNLKYKVEGEEGIEEEDFDLVVVASPQTEDKPRLGGSLVEKLKFPGQYHRTVATIVQGELIPSALGFSDQDSFTTTNFFLSTSSHIASTSKLSPVDYRGPEDENLPPVVKIFSTRPLEEEELSNMFSQRHKVVVEDWLAYPHYNVSLTPDLGSFTLAPGIFYTSRVEWSASAMEMSVLAAKNVANLATNYWLGSTEGGESSSSPGTKGEL